MHSDCRPPRNPDLADKLGRFGELFLKESRDEQEEQEFLRLRDFLDEHLPESAEDAEARVRPSASSGDNYE